MRIVRFKNDRNEILLGCDLADGHATVIDGDLFGTLARTTRRERVTKILAPLDPRAIFGIGRNYRDHAAETGAPVPERPVMFMKNPASTIGPGDAIVIPQCCQNPPEVDYETELAVIIGTSAKNVSEEQALFYVLGYTVANDISARRWQKNAGADQWVRGKSFDTFCPLGPEIVTGEEIPDPQQLTLWTDLNGQRMQHASTAEMIFTVAELIAYMSSSMTLLPGTVILTGTPSGVGFARTPPVYLMPGDSVTVGIEGIGELQNPIVGEH